MLLKMFSIRDMKAQSYGNPFYARTSGEAIRTFEQIVTSRDPQHADSPMIKFPSDFQLIEVGEFDVLSGVIAPCAHVILSTGSDFLN